MLLVDSESPVRPRGSQPSEHVSAASGPKTTRTVASRIKEIKLRDWRLNIGFNIVPGISMSPLMFLDIPLAIILGFYYRTECSWSLIGWGCCVYYVKECLPMSVALHRYFSHKGFQCNRLVQFGLHWLACLASQGPPLWWASKHRRHHAGCDTVDDPHTPVAYSRLYGWIGWIYLPGAEGPIGSGHDEEFIRDHLRFPELVIMESFSWVPVWLVHALFYNYGGGPWLVYVSIWSGVACQLLTCYFNVMFHPDDHDDETGTCKAIDMPSDFMANGFGEAYHAWHHVHPRAYHRPGVDVPYWTFIKPCLMLGIFHGNNILHTVKSEPQTMGPTPSSTVVGA